MLSTASTELPLLFFSILVPSGIVALGLLGCLRGFCAVGTSGEGADDAAAGKKLATLALIPAVLVIVGLCASFFHLGSASHAFGMMSGLGTSPLTNEIACAALAIIVAAVYVVLAFVKPNSAGIHKGFGVALVVLGLATAVMTGLAYSIRTIPTWDGPYGWAGQLFLALALGASLAALVLALGDANGKADRVLAICAIVGALGIAAVVLAQGSMAAGVTSTAGTSLAASMGEYWTYAVAGAVCAVIGGACLFLKSNKKALAALSVVLLLVAAVLVRLCFYGIYLSVGIA